MSDKFNETDDFFESMTAEELEEWRRVHHPPKRSAFWRILELLLDVMFFVGGALFWIAVFMWVLERGALMNATPPVETAFLGEWK